MIRFLQRDDISIVSVCDVNRENTNYCEWSPGELRRKVREFISEPGWGGNTEGCLAGRDPARYIVEKYYGRQSGQTDFKGCTAYTDFRELLANESDLDAVIIGTPDHTHAVISKSAMQHGKHVYCQKPMTHSVLEAHKLAGYADDTGVATEVAIGVHASESTRLLCEWIWDGAIGNVTSVHNWSSRPFWPQGIDHPVEPMPVPESLNWDLWLGPAPYRDYHSCYQPFVWRGWKDFGNGAVGDMGCYSFDTLFRVLKLTTPEWIEASGNLPYIREGTVTRPYIQNETYPASSLICYHFPARENMPSVKIYWYDGGLKPVRPAELEDERELPEEGMLFVGDDGKILCDFSGGSPRIIPESGMKAYSRPPKTLPRSDGHIDEWIRACKGGTAADANFTYTAKVTQTLLLGNVALNYGSRIYWDEQNLKVSNAEEANTYLHRAYREGWNI
jgi:predicted dehydrogenase